MRNEQPQPRELTEAEIVLVAGGLVDNEEVVVTGKRAKDVDLAWVDLFGDMELLGVESDGSESGGTGTDPFIDIMLWIADKVADYLAGRAEDAEEREARVGNLFDPGQIDPNALMTTISDGRGTRTGTPMLNGTTFWDTNGNGRPDLITMQGSDGNHYANDGSGWTRMP